MLLVALHFSVTHNCTAVLCNLITVTYQTTNAVNCVTKVLQLSTEMKNNQLRVFFFPLNYNQMTSVPLEVE